MVKTFDLSGTIDAGPMVLDGPDAVRQSLATGPVGVALLHLERATAGTGSWPDAHHHIRAAATATQRTSGRKRSRRRTSRMA